MNLHVVSQPFLDLIKDPTPFHWTHEHEKLFQSIKNIINEDTIRAVPFTDYFFTFTWIHRTLAQAVS